MGRWVDTTAYVNGIWVGGFIMSTVYRKVGSLCQRYMGRWVHYVNGIWVGGFIMSTVYG